MQRAGISSASAASKVRIGDSLTVLKPTVPEGFSFWIESGVWYMAPTVDKDQFGGHAYSGDGYSQGERDCPCGCHMESCSSGGPVDPFGPCPKNPKRSSTPSPGALPVASPPAG